MRIISGSHRGKKITAPNNLPARPTTDFAKESLFNILNNYFHFDSISVLDIFSGTGNISYEFSARGANAVAVDDNISCTNFIARTAQLLAFDNLKVIHSDAIVYLKRTSQQFNIIFADPPYSWDNYNIIPELVFERQLLLPNGFLVIEHSSFVDFENYPKFYQLRNYGKVHFSIFAENL